MQFIYAADISSDYYTFPEDESGHLIRVLRLDEGDRIQLVDGKGGLFTAEIVKKNPKKCEVKVVEKQEEFGKRDFRLQLSIAPTKNISRYEWMLEKITEIGVDEISPVICERSERKTLKHERLNKIIVSAMKQSLKAYLPVLGEICKFEQLLSSGFHGQKFIAHCRTENMQPLAKQYQKGKDVLILIGPEGDFTDNEIKMAIEKGFVPISLGNSRLRTETAAVVACHTVNLLNE